MSIPTIFETGTIFNSGTQYTFEARMHLPDYASYMTAQGVNLNAIKQSIEASLRQDGSQASVPSVEGSVAPVGGAGSIWARVNLRPVSSQSISLVGTRILDGAKRVVPDLPLDKQPQPAPIAEVLSNPALLIPLAPTLGLGRYEVVKDSTVRIGVDNAPPQSSWVSRTQSDDPARNGNLGVNNASAGLPLWVQIGGACLAGVVAIGVVGYAARGIANLVGAVK